MTYNHPIVQGINWQLFYRYELDSPPVLGLRVNDPSGQYAEITLPAETARALAAVLKEFADSPPPRPKP